jgi:hypothetical protein
MSAELQIVSHFPGRLRVRAEPFRTPFGAEVAEQIRGETGVVAATVSSRTGSLLVEYRAREVQMPRLVELILRVGRLDAIAVDRGPLPGPRGPALRETLDRWNQRLYGASHGKLDGKSGVPGLLAGLGVLRLVIGPVRIPEWYDLLFWSFVTFVNLNPSQDSSENGNAAGR